MRAGPSRRAVLLAAIAGLAVLPAPTAATAAAVPTFPAPGVVAGAAEFASEAFADPWDYDNREDIQLDNGPVQHLDGARLADGRLQLEAFEPGHVSLVWTGFEGAFRTGRDGPLRPVSADRYTSASVRMYASQRVSASVFWDRCSDVVVDQCRGVTYGPGPRFAQQRSGRPRKASPHGDAR